MIKININNQEIIKTSKKIYQDFFEMEKRKLEQIKEYENKNDLKFINKNEMIFNLLDLFNAKNLETIITLVVSKMNELFINKKITLNEDKKIGLSYFMNIISSHLTILKDFEFFNIAILSKYLLEASTGILENKKNLENFFKELSYEEYVERFEKKHKGISKKIEKHLGSIGKKLYKDSNVFSHPIHGTSYGLKIPTQDTRNIRCLSILFTTYYITFNKIFNIFNINFNLDFFFEVAKRNKQIERNFNDYIKEKY